MTLPKKTATTKKTPTKKEKVDTGHFGTPSATRPCDVYGGADARKRTMTFREDAPPYTFISFNEPKHCKICVAVSKMYEDDDLFTQLEP